MRADEWSQKITEINKQIQDTVAQRDAHLKTAPCFPAAGGAAWLQVGEDGGLRLLSTVKNVSGLTVGQVRELQEFLDAVYPRPIRFRRGDTVEYIDQAGQTVHLKVEYVDGTIASGEGYFSNKK